MKKTIFTIIFAFIATLCLFSQTSAKVRYDGLYQSDGEEYSHFLRFYSDQSVIAISSEGDPAVIAEWFKQPFYNNGKYEISGKKISFKCTSDDGTVVYKGTIKPNDELFIKSKSLINGYKGKAKYRFVKL